jgi:hypothetical protein
MAGAENKNTSVINNFFIMPALHVAVVRELPPCVWGTRGLIIIEKCLHDRFRVGRAWLSLKDEGFQAGVPAAVGNRDAGMRQFVDECIRQASRANNDTMTPGAVRAATAAENLSKPET